MNSVCTSLSQGRHGIMKIESTVMMLNPRDDPHTILIHGEPVAQVKHVDTGHNSPLCRLLCLVGTDGHVVLFQVVVEALFDQRPSTSVKIFIIVVSLALGLIILAALIWCLWKVSFSAVTRVRVCAGISNLNLMRFSTTRHIEPVSVLLCCSENSELQMSGTA